MDVLSNELEALSLLLFGMLAVFVALLLVVYIGRLIIRVTNLMPVNEPAKKTEQSEPAIDPLTKSIIENAVSQITGGKGHVASVSKK